MVYSTRMGLQRFPIGNFQGGWNLRDAAQELEANEAQSLLNVTLAPLIGTLQQRAGKTRFDTASFPGGKRAENMYAWYPDGSTKLLLASIDGTIYSVSAAGVFTSRFVGTAGTVWAFEAMVDGSNVPRLWAMNGVDAAKKIDTTGAVSNWANSPPAGNMLKVWKNRMCISGVAATPQRVFFSNIGDPEGPVTAYGTQWTDIRSSETDQDTVTWLSVFEDQLYTHKKVSTWKVTNSNSPWDNVRVVGQGCENRFQSCVVEQKLYMFNRTGIWSVDANGSLDEESSSVGPLWTGASPRVNMAALAAVRLVASPQNRVLVALPLDGATANNYLIELIPHLNFRRLGGRHYILLPAVVLHDYHCSSLVVFRPSNNDVVIAGASDVAKVHQLFNGLDDDGVAINAYWLTGWKSLIAEEPLERLRRINVEMSGTLVVDTFKDFNLAPTFSGALTSPVPADSLWDGGTWDGGIWTDPGSAYLGRVRPEQRGRYHAIQFRNNQLDKTFKIYTAEIAFRGGKEHTE